MEVSGSGDLDLTVLGFRVWGLGFRVYRVYIGFRV